MANSNTQIEKGYTLIELLVGLAIMVLVFSFGYANFREFSYRQALASTAKTLKSDLRLAQKQASSGKKPSGCSLLDGYLFEGASTSYTITPVCAKTKVVSQAKKVSLSDVTLSFDPPGITSVLFKVLGQGNDLSSDLTIYLTHVITESKQKIVITPGGEIR